MKLTSPRLALGAFITSSAAFLPLFAFAQTVTNIPSLFTYALNILNNYVVPVIFAIAFIMFLWGVYRYFIQGGASEEKVQEGQKFVMWSVVGFVVMFSIWGIINLFINTLGFGSSAQPAFPTFNGGTSSGSLFTGSNSLTCLFGGCNSTGSTNTSSSGLGAVGSSYSDPAGTGSYVITGANTVAPNSSGGCPSNFSLSGSQCVNNTSTGSGNVSSGGSCTSNGQCTGDLACISGKCQTDPSLDTTGYGQGNGTVTSGGTCKSNDDCAGNLSCSSNDTCVTDTSLDGAGYGTGAGTVQQGGACETGNDCAGNLTCTSGVCSPDSQLDAGNGTQGAACNTDSDCSGSMQCQSGQCEPDNGLQQQNGQCTTDSDCQGNLACINGSCQVDSSLDSTDNYVDPGQSSSNSGGSVPSNGNTGS